MRLKYIFSLIRNVSLNSNIQVLSNYGAKLIGIGAGDISAVKGLIQILASSRQSKLCCIINRLSLMLFNINDFLMR